jgi:D-proline reductase (dithiol) PrdB
MMAWGIPPELAASAARGEDLRVDSFRFLPRSFRPLYESVTPPEGGRVWAPFIPRLAAASIALLTSAGVHLRDRQPAFDLERERREPFWGDPSWRSIPAGVASAELDVCHLHINPTDILADHNVALPLDRMAELAAEGVVGAAAAEHVSVMGFQERSLEDWRTQTAPAIVELLRREGADGVVLAPV